MADLLIALSVGGLARTKQSCAVGAGPSAGIEDAVDDLRDREIDEEMVARVAFLNDWERMVYGDCPPGWTREEASETITVTCKPAELERIVRAMKTLRPHVGAKTSWDAFTLFLEGCAAKGTICLWYDPVG